MAKQTSIEDVNLTLTQNEVELLRTALAKLTGRGVNKMAQFELFNKLTLLKHG